MSDKSSPSSPHGVERGPTERVRELLVKNDASIAQCAKDFEDARAEALATGGTFYEPEEPCETCAELIADNSVLREQLAERETLITALRVARKAVYAMAEGSHLLDGFGPRKRTPLDDDLDQVEAALASVGKGVNG